MNTKITIPSHYYVGMRGQGGGLPLAFITPNGNDKSAQNRIKTVNNWAKGKNALDTVVIENVALHEFKLTSDIRRSGRFGSGDKWCIEDPRGFELEISSSNLAYLIQNCIIENGTILDACIWARQNGTNVLLSVETELYSKAVKYTQINNTTESIKNLEKGNNVVLKNGITGTYLGKYHLLKKPYNSTELLALHAPNHIIQINDKTPSLHITSILKLSSISSKNKLTDLAAEKLVNDTLQTNGCIVDDWTPLLAAFARKPVNYHFNLVDLPEIYPALNRKTDETVIVKLKQGSYGILEKWGDSNKEYTCNEVSINQTTVTYKYNTTYQTHFSNPRFKSQRQEKVTIEFSESDVESVYLLEIESATKIGNNIKRFI